MVAASLRPSSHPLRQRAVEMMLTKFPVRADDAWFQNDVCQGRTHDFAYTCSSDLVSWYLWELGCAESLILCRNIEHLNASWSRDGIQKLIWGAQRLAAWRPFVLGREPEPGDILHLGRNSLGEPEHICVFLNHSDEGWVTADGMNDEHGDPCVKIVKRRFYGYKLTAADGSQKQVNGWVDICQVPLTRGGLMPPPASSSTLLKE